MTEQELKEHIMNAIKIATGDNYILSEYDGEQFLLIKKEG